MQKINRIICTISGFFLMTVFLSTCVKVEKKQPDSAFQYASFRDIPGVTEDEIKAIEALREQYDRFTYAMIPSNEAFYSDNSGIRGFSTLFCEWLTRLFDIPFIPEFSDFDNLIAKLARNEIDFTGSLTSTEERRKIYFMTTPIALQMMQYFRIEGSPPLEVIAGSRPLRYSFMRGTATINLVTSRLVPGTYELVLATDIDDVYRMLKSGEVDAHFDSNKEIAFDIYDDVISSNFNPLIYTADSMMTQNPKLASIISVVQKALDNGALLYLAELHNTGDQEYLKHKLSMRLSKEERQYIEENPVVSFAAEAGNYPVSFYNTRERSWQGIAFDVLREVEALTGLRFERANSENDDWPVILKMLEDNTVSMITELMYTEERARNFLWPGTVILEDNFALISRLDFRSVSLNEIMYLKIGLLKGYGTTDLFREWFPDHTHTVEYENSLAAFDALDRGEVDMVMTTNHELLILTHYMERAGFKANFVFDIPFNSTFGFNGKETVLCSIIDKALNMIDVKIISDHWMRRTYDYRRIVLEAQYPWLIGSSVLFLCVLALVVVLFIRSRRSGMRLKKLVDERTQELEAQTSMLATIIDSSQDFIFCKDLQLRYTQCNKALRDFMDMNLKDILGKSNMDLFMFSPETAEGYSRTDRDVVRNKQPLVFEESILSQADGGKEVIVETIKVPLIQDGEVTGIMGMSRDITKRKEMENALVLQTATLTTLFDSIPDIIFTKDLDLRYTQYNKAFADHFGISKEAAIGKSNIISFGFSAEISNKHNDLLRAAIKDGQIHTMENILPKIDGSLPTYESMHAPLMHNGAVIGVLGIARDITKRKEMEDALALQTAKLQAILDSIPDLVMCKDLNLVYTQCNKAAEEVNGRTEAETVGKTDFEVWGFPPEVTEKVIAEDRIALNECRKTVIEELIPFRKYGINRILETVRVPLMQNGVVVGLLVIARDITQRKNVELELELQTAMLSTLFDAIPDIIFTMDTSLRFTQCNRSFLEHFGLGKEDLINKGEEALKIPVELEEEHNKWNRWVIEEGQSFSKEETVPRFDGSMPVFDTAKRPLILNGVVIGLLGVGHDITHLKKVERELELQTATLTTLFDSIPDFIFTMDTSLRFTQCNKSFFEHYGLSSKEGLINKGEEASGISAEIEEEHNNWNRKVIEEGQTIVLEERIPRFDGTMPVYETVKMPLVLNGAVVGLLCIGHNITQRKEMEEAALAASQSKSVFLANMSHEIRTPMNSIMGFSELAMDSETSPKTREYLDKIQTNAEWLLQIINDILDISKIESGKIELEKIPFDMHELFESCRTLIIPKAVEKGITLQFYAEPSVGKRPLGDPTRLRQIFVNLLSNAVKFTNSGTVKVFTEIINFDEKKVTFHFEIKDSGIGMTDEQIKRIFEPFIQAETGTTRKYGGTGLGLAISKNLIELMGGRLSVESTPGLGSKFNFDLVFDTIDISGYEKFERKAMLDDIEKPTFDGEILLCEDNMMNQQVICEHLSRVCLKSIVAENGKVGVDKVKERKEKGGKQFDLIFMDIHMPVMDGVEAATKIIELETGVPIVAMTANIMSSDMEVYKTSGMRDCIGKPFTSQELWRCLLKYLVPVSRGSRNITMPQKNTRIEEDQKFQKELNLTFARINREMYKEIVNSLESGDIELAHRLAHTLKSNAGQIKKTSLQTVSAGIEYALKDGKNFVTEEQLKNLNTELTAVLEEFQPYLDELSTQTQSSQTPVLEPGKARELIVKLEPLLESGNSECVNFLDELRTIPGSGQLVQQIENYDFDAALITFGELKKELGKTAEQI